MDEDESSYDIDIALPDGCTHIDETLLRRAIVRTLAIRQCLSARIDVVLVDDDHIARINAEYLRHTGPTDVISFDLHDDDPAITDGQLVISVDTARREATQRGHTVSAEVALYAVHGTLHLLGFDDHDSVSAGEMHELEDRILMELGIGPVYRSASSPLEDRHTAGTETDK